MYAYRIYIQSWLAGLLAVDHARADKQKASSERASTPVVTSSLAHTPTYTRSVALNGERTNMVEDLLGRHVLLEDLDRVHELAHVRTIDVGHRRESVFGVLRLPHRGHGQTKIGVDLRPWDSHRDHHLVGPLRRGWTAAMAHHSVRFWSWLRWLWWLQLLLLLKWLKWLKWLRLWLVPGHRLGERARDHGSRWLTGWLTGWLLDRRGSTSTTNATIIGLSIDRRAACHPCKEYKGNGDEGELHWCVRVVVVVVVVVVTAQGR